MTDSRTLGQSVPKEGLFLMDGIEGLRSLPKHSVDMLLTDPPYGTTRNYWDVPLPLPELDAKPLDKVKEPKERRKGRELER